MLSVNGSEQASSRNVNKKKSKKAGKKPKAAPTTAAPAASTDRIDFIERRVWRFCRTPNDQSGASYVDPLTTFPDFKAASVSDLIFHRNNNTGPVLDNNVQEFARGLHNHLGDNNVQPIGNPADARAAVEDAARQIGSPMQALLDAVVNTYR